MPRKAEATSSESPIVDRECTVAEEGFFNLLRKGRGKAQASEAMVAGKIVADRVFDYFARFGTLPESSDIFIGDYIPGTGSYIDLAVWVKASSAIGGTEWGYVKVTMAQSNVHTTARNTQTTNKSPLCAAGRNRHT